MDKYILKVENRAFTEENGVYADSTFFRLLAYDFVGGDPEHALDEPCSVVLSRRPARRLFDDQAPFEFYFLDEQLQQNYLYANGRKSASNKIKRSLTNYIHVKSILNIDDVVIKSKSYEK